LSKRPQILVLGDLNRDLFLHLPSFPKPGRDNPVQSFAWSPGGSTVNIAAALVNLKIPTGVIGRIGRDTEGRALLRDLSTRGIHTRNVQIDSEKPTAIRVIPITPNGGRILMGARGANASLDKDGLREAFSGIRHLHVSGFTFVEPTSRTAAIEALRTAREGGATTSLDFTWRAASGASEAIREALSYVTVALSSAPELRIALGFRQLSRAAEAACELGTEQVAATLGSGGCRIFSARGAFRAPPFNVRGGDQSGAEDLYSAGYIFGLLQDASPFVCGVIGNAAAAAGGGGEQPYRSLNRERLAHLLQEGEPQARGKKHIGAIREAMALLSNRGPTERKR
jgi:ribokinase